ncbi:MAG: copper resistance protein CopC [Actinomycetota bacterium]|nr:copper resistance protein CopC [Actinomycetota bacterium]
MRYLLALVALVGLALLGSAGPAVAHNELIGSDPADGATVATSPAQVRLTFDLPPKPGFSTVTVTGPHSSQWQAGPPAEAGAVVSAPIRALGPAGQYTIAYQVLSADGHPVRGAVRFTLTTPGPGTAAVSPAHSSTNPSGPAAFDPATSGSVSRDGTPMWPWLAGAGALLMAGVVVALRIGRSA